MEQTKKPRHFSISAKLVLAIVVCIAVIMCLLVWMVSSEMSKVLLAENEALLEQTTASTLERTEGWIESVLSMLEAERDTIYYDNMGPAEIRAYVTHTAGQNSAYPAGIYAALSGDMSLIHASFVPGADYDLASKSWYQDGLASEDFILGDVYFDEDSQSHVVGASGQLRDRRDDSVRGVVAADVYLDSVSDAVRDVTLGETGGIFIVDRSSNMIIGHKDPAVTGADLTTLQDGVYPLAQAQIASRASGLQLVEGTYILTEDIPDTNWVAVAYVVQDEVLADVRGLDQMLLIAAVIAGAAMALLVFIMVRRIIGRPVRELQSVAAKIAQGDLNQQIAYESNDEIGGLASDFREVTRMLREYKNYIGEIASTLDQIASGNLDFSLKYDYTGEFAKIKDGLDRLSQSLNHTIGQIQQASHDVAIGSQQVAAGANSLTSGASKQASAVDSLAGHIGELTESVGRIAAGSQKAREISQDVRRGLVDSSAKMDHMSGVIQHISTQSSQINGIVKTIEDIAFQTNILALNAAVEAARAGETGKGFAVVAEEVRTLAGRTSEAAQRTTALLSETVASMDEGVIAARDTGEALLEVVKGSDQMSELINSIAEYTEKQAANAKGISGGVDQLSELGADNVRVAETSAEASDELRGQADMLSKMVSRFRLRGGHSQ